FDLVLHSDPLPPRLAGANISARLEEVCLKALAKEPSDRYRTAADLRDDLNIVSVAMSSPESCLKVDDNALWGLTPVRLAAVVGTGLLLCGLAVGVFFATSNFWRKPVEHTSPGGEINVALADAPGPKFAAPAANGMVDRKLLLQELRELLREEPPAGEGMA